MFVGNTANNPADYASRGLDISQNKKDEKLFQGPLFLWNNESTSCMHNKDLDVNNDDLEVTEEKVNMVKCNKRLVVKITVFNCRLAEYIEN